MAVTTGEISLTVDPELASVRPVVMGAVVRAVHTGANSDEKGDFIQSLMDHTRKVAYDPWEEEKIRFDWSP